MKPCPSGMKTILGYINLLIVSQQSMYFFLYLEFSCNWLIN